MTAADIEAPLRFYKEARADGGFDAGIEMALRAVLASRSSCSASSAIPRALHRARRIASATSSWPRGCRSSCGAASPTMNCWISRRRQAQSPGDARAAGAADAGRARRPTRSSPTSPASGCICATWPPRAGRAAVPGLRRQPAPGVPARDGAVLREHRARGSQRARSAARRTTRSSTSGWPSTTAFRTSTAADSGACRSATTACAAGMLGQGSVLTVTSYANRTSPVLRGKWILENIIGTPPPPPPPNVPPLKDTDAEGRVALDARADGRSTARTRHAPAAIS